MNARRLNGGGRLYVGRGRTGVSMADSISMAGPQSLIGHRIIKCILLPLGAALVLSGLVALSNNNIKVRCRLDELRADKAYLQTRVGLLEQRWHRETSREIITSRASTELGLATPASPGTIVVVNDPGRSRHGTPD